MASLTGLPSIPSGGTGQVDTVAQMIIGARYSDLTGNGYIYLKGADDVSLGSWVNYNLTAGTTTLLTSSAVGLVAIAMATIGSTTYGYFQVFGTNASAKADTMAEGVQVYIDGTDGRVDDAKIVSAHVVKAISRTASASNVATVEIAYPYVNNAAID